MKKLFLLLVFFKGMSVFAQQITLFNQRENIVYKGLDNPMTAVMENYPCKSILLTTDNGKIEQDGCSCNYRPGELGLGKIKFWLKTSSKPRLVGQIVFRVKSVGPPVAFIGMSNGGLINLKVLKAQGGLRSYALNGCSDAPFQVVEYKFTALRNNAFLFSYKNTGAIYDSTLLSMLDKLKGNDYLLVSSIVCIGPTGVREKAPAMEFTIKE